MTNVKSLVSENRPAVLAIFDRYNINAQPSAENVIHAYILHKEPFLVDLYREINGNHNYFNEIFSPFEDENDDDDFFVNSSSTSIEKIDEPEEKEKDGSGWSNFQRVFGDGVKMATNLFNSGAEVYGNFKAAENGQTVPTILNNPFAPSNSSIQESEKDKTVFYVGGGIAVLILLFIVLKK